MAELDEQALAEVAEWMAREDALKNLASFREYMSRTLHPDFDYPPARHHEAMIMRLEALERGDIDRLAITMPPGHGKTVWGSVIYGSWYGARNPGDQVICISANLALAEEFAGRRKRAMATREWELLTGIQVDGRQANASFKYGNGGHQFAVGVGGSVVGRRADLIILDDYIASHEQASSPTAREKMHSWWLSEVATRLKEGENPGKVLVVCTRWWSDDLLGRLLETEPERWELLELPMLCMDPESDPLQRELNDPLWPEHFSEQRVKEARRDPVLWQSLWQQRPLNEANSWLDPNTIDITENHPEPRNLNMYCAMDLAATATEKSDYTVVGVVGVDHERNIWILDWYRERLNSEDIVERLWLIKKQWAPLEYLIDDDLGSRHFARLAGSMQMLTGGSPLTPRIIPTRGKSKEARALTFQSLARQGYIHSDNGPWVPELLKEISTFPRVGRGYHDDQIDVLSLLCNYHTRMSPGLAPEKPLERIPIQGGIKEIDGQQYTTASLDEMWEDRRPIRLGARRI